jgi:anti-sigma B factor antagonist
MKIEVRGDTIQISEVEELGAASAGAFRAYVRAALKNGQRNVDVDLSRTTYIDSCGLGALISLQKAASRSEGRVRLLNPKPSVQQILDLTRMEKIFDIVRT